ncbi:uncharacterized protein FTOL_05497 [Fusarium torulosum]|uniref:Uncharacterized protein n=1 Tax=Fusarium torulosum TaxID=33205 RepID=A0AAE8SHB1_9HYPO|nr:uncharacterized protein FTOL_05497 [Fusarium torulosum]
MNQGCRRDRRPAKAYRFEDIKARFKEELVSTTSDPMSKLNTEDLIYHLIWEHVRGRTLMTIKRGSISLGCSFARPGEVICVFLGCDFPVLLRPYWNNTWKYMSECYVWDLEASRGLLGAVTSP